VLVADPTFFGESFTLPERVGSMPLWRFAKIASGGIDSTEMDGFVAMYDLVKSCLTDDDWQRFNQVADANAADDDDIMGFCGQVILAVSERPTKRPSVSPDGPQVTPQSSESTPAEQAMEMLTGRPDLQAFVEDAEKHRATVSA
jgi:hypothetical protein